MDTDVHAPAKVGWIINSLKKKRSVKLKKKLINVGPVFSVTTG